MTSYASDHELRAGALSAAVELQQAIFTVGHCRLRDLLPNLLAVALAIGATAGLRRLRRTSARESGVDCDR